MKFVATALSVLLTTSIATALRGKQQDHANTSDSLSVPEIADGVLIDVMNEEFGARHSRHLEMKTPGTLNLLVVQVIDGNGEVALSTAEMLNEFYGGNKYDSFKRVIEGCSYNKLEILQPQEGIVELIIDDAIAKGGNFEKDFLQNKKMATMRSDYENDFDLIVVCIPEGSKKNSATSDWQLSYYDGVLFQNGDYCGDVPQLMWIVGQHFLDLGFSGTEDSKYGDLTGHMGLIINGGDDKDSSRRCYNAANSYQLDWYTGKYASFNQLDLLNQSQEIFLNGVSMYKEEGKAYEIGLISVRIEHEGDSGGKDWYIGYNYKQGINEDTPDEPYGGPNKVHVLEKDNGPYEKGQSTRIAILDDDDNNSFSWRVESTIFLIEVENISGGYAYIRLSARSLTPIINVPNLITNSEKFVLSVDDDLGTGLVNMENNEFLLELHMEHEGDAGGIDWYIQSIKEDEVQILMKENGGVSNVVATVDMDGYQNGGLGTSLKLGGNHEWRIGNSIVTLQMVEVAVVFNIYKYFFLRAVDSPTFAPSESPGPTITPTSTPTASPTAGPTSAPTATLTAGPTLAPTSSNCQDDPDWEFRKNPGQSCKWFQEDKQHTWKNPVKFCGKTANGKGPSNTDKTKVWAYCKLTCYKLGNTNGCK